MAIKVLRYIQIIIIYHTLNHTLISFFCSFSHVWEKGIKKALRMGELDKVYRNTFIFPCIVSVPV